MLREVAQQMKQLHPAIEHIGGCIPSDALPYIFDFMNIAEQLLQDEKNDIREN